MASKAEAVPLFGALTEPELTELLRRRGMVAEDPRLRALCRSALQLADVDASVLLLGESGTGKDCVAKLIHRASRRAGGPFVRLNCGAIPSELFEAELFGYEGSTFTGGLYAGKKGLLEAADGGTIFLDEIGEMSPDNQVKLLRFLETKQNLRLGATDARTLDVRVVSATHRDLRAMTEGGQFRRDLFYRVCVATLTLPPLRERPKDVAALAQACLARLSAEGGGARRLTPEGLTYLQSLAWPGNVRQLQNLLERVCVLEDGQAVDAAMLRRCAGTEALPPVPREEAPPPRRSLRQAVSDFERDYIAQVVAETRSLAQAAAVLEVELPTLHRKKRQYGIYKRRRSGGGGRPGTPIA